jgi:hypothetical protein
METLSIEWDRDGHLKIESDEGILGGATSAQLRETAAPRRHRAWVLVATVSVQCVAIVPAALALT